MSNIVDRLRNKECPSDDELEAADAIEGLDAAVSHGAERAKELRAEIARLKAENDLLTQTVMCGGF